MSEMPRIFVSPSRYVQCRGVMKEIGVHVRSLGKKAVIIENWDGARKLIEDSLDKNSIKVGHVESDLRECTHSNIERLAKIANQEKADMILGAGGGKAVDTAKAVAAKIGAATVTVPTQSATNADSSGLSVVYTEKHQFVEYLFHKRNPDLVIVDSGVLAKAPYTHIVSGMGDALACMFEGDACAMQPNAKNLRGGRPTAAAVYLTHLCYRNLMTYGIQAAQDAKNGFLTPAVEKIIESVKLLSCLGFESSGLAAAHAIHNGMTVMPGLSATHGQLVAFCVISQLILEGRPPSLVKRIMKWLGELGLPLTLEGVGIVEFSENDLMKAACKACDPKDTIGNMPINITPEMIRDAVLAADSLGKDHSKMNACC